ncbi:MAG: tetratricopeptide repeat protein [Acidobacteria bacterium]|jgi:tetratricopeptide (TPR) repeat protein|nr:tetratricopeptide repeat protein [Acidobacteriota bacterium]
MNFQKHILKSLATFFIIWTFIIGGFLSTAQDLPPNEDLSLGASVFVFRSSGRTAQKKFVSSNRTKRTKIQRLVAVKNIRKQYNNLAVVTARRKRVKIFKPEPVQIEVAKKSAKKSAKEASLTLTGAAQFYYDNNEMDKSIDLYREAIDLDEKNTDAILGLSDALASKASDLLEKDKPQEARGLFDEAVKLNVKNSVAYSGLGEIYDSLDDNDKAIFNYEKALSLNADLTELYAPLGILYTQKNEIAKAEDFLNKAIALNRNDASIQYFLGVVRLKQNRYEDARLALTESTKLDATMPEAHYSLGEALAKLDREAEAVNEYKEAIRLKPTYVDAWFGLGAAEYERENYVEAIKAYTETNRLKNDIGAAHANLADAYRQLKEYDKANGEYSIAAVFIKDDAELYSNWGFCLGKVQKWNNAILRLNEAVALSADHIDYTNLGWAYYNASQIDLKSKLPETKAEGKAKLQQAKAALQKAVSIKNDFAPAYINLGITQNDLGEYQAAVESLKRANELRKDSVFAINELGIAYRKLNEYDNAIKQFERAVALNDKYAIGLYNLGEAQFRRRNVKEAKKAHEKLKKLDTNLAKALEILIIGAKMK